LTSHRQTIHIWQAGVITWHANSRFDTNVQENRKPTKMEGRNLRRPSKVMQQAIRPPSPSIAGKKLFC
jgi:hypothetical protein